jgi:hypothetical protein
LQARCWQEGKGGGAAQEGRTFIDQVILASSARFSLSVSYLVPFSPLISQFVKVHKKEATATVKSSKTRRSASNPSPFKPIEELPLSDVFIAPATSHSTLQQN